MKVNEAPEKIYIPMSRHWYGIDSLFYPVRQYKNDTEYIRTDAFIEKAIKWISNNCYIPHSTLEEFIKYVKGEQFMEKPKWCNYEDANQPIWGCWSLLNGRVTSEDYCKNCERYKKE